MLVLLVFTQKNINPQTLLFLLKVMTELVGGDQ